MSNKVLKLLPHQIQALNNVGNRDRCAFFHDMGLGKTFTGAEQMMRYKADINLVVCQVSKVKDWVKHFEDYYDLPVFDLTDPRIFENFFLYFGPRVGVINYDKLHRRPKLFDLRHIAVMFDESSMIKNFSAARTKASLKLNYDYVILLSGTPMGGKYEELWTQCRLLDWHIAKSAFWSKYVITRDTFPASANFPIKVIVGYKNIENLKKQLRDYGAQFLRTQDVMTLPEQNFQTIEVDNTQAYNDFMAKYYVTVDDKEMVGDNSFKRLAYARMLASAYNPNKKQAVRDLLESTCDRFVIFYNYKLEFEALKEIATALKRPIGYVNGDGRDLSAYSEPNCVILCQSIAGSKGINLQEINRLIIYGPPLSGEDYMQMQKRIHRIGQTKPCFYYLLCTKNSVEEQIYKVLAQKETYTLDLFELTYGRRETIRDSDPQVPRKQGSLCS